MSLILEALKKSERERRLGESPSIGSPIMAVRRRRNLLPFLIGLIAIGLVALWWLRREHAPDATPAPATATLAPATASTPAATAPATPDATTFDGQAANADTRAEAAQSSAATRLPRSKVPAGSTTGQPPEQREKIESGELAVANPQLLKPGEPVTVRESEAVAASAAALPPAPANPAPAAAPAAPKPGDTMKPPAASPPARSAASASEPAATPATSVAVPPPAASDNSTAGDSIKLMWELPYATRRELPEIRLTMHVFASDPAQRFVIINDARRVQGDDVEGLKLVEIRSDGVVFEREGVRFLYPRGGR